MTIRVTNVGFEALSNLVDSSSFRVSRVGVEAIGEYQVLMPIRASTIGIEAIGYKVDNDSFRVGKIGVEVLGTYIVPQRMGRRSTSAHRGFRYK